MNKPIVSIIMGSDSDLPIMKEAAEILEEFQISYEIKIVSAHRTPNRMFEYAKDAAGRGLKVIIAGAGGAAHLPGMVASLTTLPVIGVPVQTKTLNGVDSLYSIVQMPPGIPVATVAINGAKNAGLLAAKILGSFDKEISKKVEKYSQNLEKIVLQKGEKLEKLGYKKYLDLSKK
jgi:5-(carboxyamino)imidazole ribonucleotide mutase